MQTDETKRRVLVIEDEPLIGRVCMKTLSALGFEVDVATDGLRALEMARREAYDLYLCDIRTPRMNDERCRVLSAPCGTAPRTS